MLATFQNARPLRTCNIPGVGFELSRESGNEVDCGRKQFAKSRRNLNTESHRLCRGRAGRTALKQRKQLTDSRLRFETMYTIEAPRGMLTIAWDPRDFACSPCFRKAGL
jgi:hypothetical protein